MSEAIKRDLSAEGWNGFPPNESQTAWHWLRHKQGLDLSPWRWDADYGGPGCGGWDTDDNSDPDGMARQFDYVSPCVEPDELTRLRQLCATQTETIASLTRQAADNGQRLMRYHRDMRAIRAIVDEMHAASLRRPGEGRAA